MKVLMTSLGFLGETVAPMLAGRHELRLLRRRKEDVPYEVTVGDIKNLEDVRKAAEGVDAIIHPAAVQSVRTHTYEDFYRTNITGTHNVLEAARELRIRKIVHCSSIVVYGALGLASPYFAGREEAVSVDESFPFRTRTAYELSKVINEIMCEHYSRLFGVRIFCLRYGHFPRRPVSPEYAALFWRGWYVHVNDCAAATILALENESIAYGAYNITSALPFSPEDNQLLVKDPRSVAEKYYGPEIQWLRSRGIELDYAPIYAYFEPHKAMRELGYEPKHDLRRMVATLQAQQAGG